MIAQRVLADVKIAGKPFVVRARLRNKRADHIVLALGERLELPPGRLFRAIAFAARKLDEDAARRGAIEPELALVYLRNCLEEDRRRCFVLTHYAGGALQNGSLVQQVVLLAAKEEHLRVARLDQAANCAGALAAKQLR